MSVAIVAMVNHTALPVDHEAMDTECGDVYNSSSSVSIGITRVVQGSRDKLLEVIHEAKDTECNYLHKISSSVSVGLTRVVQEFRDDRVFVGSP